MGWKVRTKFHDAQVGNTDAQQGLQPHFINDRWQSDEECTGCSSRTVVVTTVLLVLLHSSTVPVNSTYSSSSISAKKIFQLQPIRLPYMGYCAIVLVLYNSIVEL